jgi:tight adherence protein B
MHAIDIVIALAVVVILYVVWQIMGQGSRQTQKRIERIKARKTVSVKAADMSLRRKNTESKGIGYYLMKPLPNFDKLGDRLARAGRTISPKQYVFRRFLVSAAILFLIVGVLKKSFLLGVPCALILGVWLPLKWMQFGINKQNKAFLRLFPDAIDLIVRGLRSGLPVSESLVLVSQEVSDPLGAVFRNIVNTMKLGVPMEKALQETARKLDMTEFNFFTTSIVLQRETGGNLSEILNNLSEVLRNRFLMRMKIKAMSSEARASAYIIGALPFVVLLAVSATSPGYMAPLWDDPRGNMAAGIAAGMLAFGGFIMYRMTKFEI